MELNINSFSISSIIFVSDRNFSVRSLVFLKNIIYICSRLLFNLKIISMYVSILNPKGGSIDVLEVNTDDVELINDMLKERGYDEHVQIMVSHDLIIKML